ncbi:MAG: Asp-tRNA(Asn)/Glu-tRNA(Gln) amidotransferase subunit GatC [Patescibacteria group bacterium]|jgi:aspartyl-tRNA(Asn)/glutamyl-tRNA(Gln) amidotransferase subunit C
MAKLSIQEIEHIAKLSRLELSEDEKELYSHQLSDVLAYVEQLNEVNTDNVEPAANVTGLENIWRDDEVENSGIVHKDIESNAPEFKAGSFVVPGVFE